MWKMNIKLNIPSILSLFLLVVFFKQMVLMFVVPIWQTPDEQAHFAQVAYFAENLKMPYYPLDLNREILESERLLGTERDQFGNNKFTFHPEYKIEYTLSYTGKYENQINTFPKSYRSEYLKQEAANYPPLFYWFSSLGYRLFYENGLIDRVFAARSISLIFYLIFIVVSYKIAKLLFKNNQIYIWTYLLIISFQPMLSYVFAGVNSDNLMNLLFSILLLLCLQIISFGVNIKKFLQILIVFILLFLTKPQYVLGIPIFLIALVLSFQKINFQKILNKKSIVILLLVPLLIFIITSNQAIFLKLERIFYTQSFYQHTPKEAFDLSKLLSFFNQTFRHSYAEVVPWYWGIYKWLGITYPRFIHRPLNYLTVIAILGILLKILIIAKNIRLKSLEKINKLFIFLICSSLIYFLGITLFNYLFYLNHNFTFGIQGRYYFPVITSHLGLLLIGIITLIPEKLNRIKEMVVKSLGIVMITFSLYAIYLLSSVYYDLTSLNLFINQASQYKPVIYKGYFLLFWLYAFIFTLVIFIFKFIKLKNEKILKEKI